MDTQDDTMYRKYDEFNKPNFSRVQGSNETGVISRNYLKKYIPGEIPTHNSINSRRESLIQPQENLF